MKFCEILWSFMKFYGIFHFWRDGEIYVTGMAWSLLSTSPLVFALRHPPPRNMAWCRAPFSILFFFSPSGVFRVFQGKCVKPLKFYEILRSFMKIWKIYKISWSFIFYKNFPFLEWWRNLRHGYGVILLSTSPPVFRSTSSTTQDMAWCRAPFSLFLFFSPSGVFSFQPFSAGRKFFTFILWVVFCK